MLIQGREVRNLLKQNGIDVTGVLHIGAFECEELDTYLDYFDIEPEDILWIDGVPQKVEEARKKGIVNVFNAVITDKDDEDVTLNVTNNVASSSILDLGTHATEYPSIRYTHKIESKSVTIDSFFKRNTIDPSKYTLWNLDIQGAEGLALKGGIESIAHAKALYLEVNQKELYKGCMLLPELDALVESYGFQRIRTEMTPYGWGDALYIRT